MKLLLAPLILLLSALAFPALDAPRRARCYGWLAREMDKHWRRLWRERTYHAAKNIMSEWVRLDPQRAGKLFSFLLTISLLLNALLLAKITG